MNQNLVGTIYGRSSIKFAHIEIDQSEQRLEVVAMFANQSGQNEQSS
jgi:hypothetical protein